MLSHLYPQSPTSLTKANFCVGFSFVSVCRAHLLDHWVKCEKQDDPPCLTFSKLRNKARMRQRNPHWGREQGWPPHPWLALLPSLKSVTHIISFSFSFFAFFLFMCKTSYKHLLDDFNKCALVRFLGFKSLDLNYNTNSYKLKFLQHVLWQIFKVASWTII